MVDKIVPIKNGIVRQTTVEEKIEDCKKCLEGFLEMKPTCVLVIGISDDDFFISASEGKTLELLSLAAYGNRRVNQILDEK